MPRKKQIENALENKALETVSSVMRNTEVDDVILGAMSASDEDRQKVEEYIRDLGSRERVDRTKKEKRELYATEDIIGAEDDNYAGLYTEEQARAEAFQKLNQSYLSAAILKGVVQKAERRDQDPEHPQMPTAIVNFENEDFFEIKIPFTEFLTPDRMPEEIRGNDAREMLNYMDYLINLRNGSPIRFIVQKLDERTGEVIASRKRAMNRMVKRYWFDRDREGRFRINLGSKVLGTVIYVARNYICVESMGIEKNIYVEDVSWQRYSDLTQAPLKREPNGIVRPYKPGDPVELRVIGIKRTFDIPTRDKEGNLVRDDKGHLVCEKDENGKDIILGENEIEGRPNIHIRGIDTVLSIKEVYRNPDESKFNKFVLGDKVMAEITHVDQNGIFCKLSGIRSGKIRFDPDNTDIPRPGQRCLVRVVAMNKDNFNITCEIVRRFW